MAACIWIQYEPAAAAVGLYSGFIHATVTGDTSKPPPLPPPRLQASVPQGTTTYGMLVSGAVAGVATLGVDPNFSVPTADLGGVGQFGAVAVGNAVV